MAKSPIGLVFPLQNSNNGYFGQSFDTLSQKKTNVLNILKTRRGERRFQPLFGTRLHTLVFDPNDEMLLTMATNMVKEDIYMWEKDVDILDTSLKFLKNNISDIDIYRLNVQLYIRLLQTNETFDVDVAINNIAIQ